MNHERSSESELKFALDGKAEFEVLMKALPQPARRLRQENYFFDTPGSELRRSGWALRLRLETDASGVERAELTAKGAAMRVGALSRRPEINAELAIPTANSIVAGGYDLTTMNSPPVDRIREFLSGAKLIPLVSFSNERVAIPFPGLAPYCTLELDATVYKGNIREYELEIESEDAEVLRRAAASMEDLFGRLKIELKSGSRSKLQRALEYIGPGAPA